MRYQLDTIPVWDAVKEESECPLCALRRRNERMYVDSFLGASVMEPSTRVEVNAKGFCAAHFAQLFREKNRLGLALVTDTYLQDVMGSLRDIWEKPEAARRLFGGSGEAATHADQIEKRIGDCVLCERLDTTMRRYAYTLVHLYQRDAEFRKAFEASKGLCLPDTALCLRLAREELGGKEYAAFSETLARLCDENLKRVEEELAWFTQKFDYRNQDKPWGNSRDAVERAIQKLQGYAKGTE